MSSSMSATELSRLRRQKRLESSSPIHRTPANIKRRTKRCLVSDDKATKEAENGLKSATPSFDEDAITNGAERNFLSPPQSSKLLSHNRSTSLSSLSINYTAEPEEFKSPSPHPLANAVTPPESPRHRSRSATPGIRSNSPSRLPSSITAPSTAPYVEGRRTPNRPMRRSNSTQSMPTDIKSADVPLDELMSSGMPPKAVNKTTNALVPAGLHSNNTNAALVVSGAQSGSMLNRMSNALQLQMRPVHMNPDEERLWDVVQELVQNASSNHNSNDAKYWQEKFEQREQQWSEQQAEHDRAMRAIQRVMADVTTERDQEIEELRQELENSQQQRDDTILRLTQKLKEMQQQVNTAKEERDAAEVKFAAQQKLDKDTPEESTESLETLMLDNKKQAERIEQLEQDLKTAVKEEDKDKKALRKELDERTSSLESAKQIIGSLEAANGALARELRAKLKEKEDELAHLSSTSADRKKTLDSLATELRELQRQQQRPRITSQQVANQRSLCQMLEKNVKALRQAAVQHEAKNDQSSVHRISQIVSETFTELKHNLEYWESYLTNAGAFADTACSSDAPQDSSVESKDDEMNTMKIEFEKVTNEAAELRAEVTRVKDELTKKGRELAVLKDSLNMDYNGLGYISDDATDAEDDPVSSPGRYSGPKASNFNGSLLVHGGPGVHSANPNAAEMSDATAAEIQMLKNEIIKHQKEREAKEAELQASLEKQDSLKLIISSLEKANKSMLEDLRSRLSDSNAAIASLLEKSIEHEKTIGMLRKELDGARKEHQKEEKKAAKLRDENLVFSMRLAAKDREVEELQNSLSQYEGQEVQISKTRLSSVEEKKDDAVSDDEHS